jgi:hypothetical protein
VEQRRSGRDSLVNSCRVRKYNPIHLFRRVHSMNAIKLISSLNIEKKRLLELGYSEELAVNKSIIKHGAIYA